MHGPALSGWLLVALCGTTGGYCLARMRGCSGPARAAAGGEALMGLGMAAMAVPAAAFAPPGWAWPVYAAVFGGAALAALWAARAGPVHHLHHLVGSLAMVYMALAMVPGAAPAHHGGHPAAGVPALTGALLAYYAVYVLRAGVRLAPAGGSPPGRGARPAAPPGGERDPGLAGACRLSMGLAMLAMLLTL
ncbi:DUF5134 domain-containing protein [Streptomyces sp. NPDC001985]|uniref:DUF5134 domain-containing protein n=1 Tax=Streptomyces sp. NPDC001985 TaxID=3154406 RepID=UPI00332001DA